jgi:uncharacterized membrane protein
MTGSMRPLLDFLDELDSHKISHRLDRARDDAIMVQINTPGEYWEVEFFANGEVEVERFTTQGVDQASAELLQDIVKRGS